MEFGVHLPLISFRGEQRSIDDLLAFTEAARDLGYTHLCANDHLVFSRPWLDGPTALAAVLAHSGEMTLATTVAVPVLRGPAATAKILAAIDVLSGGRLVVGLGPGSSARDYELVGVRFEERWKRLDEAVQTFARTLASRRRRIRGCVLLHRRFHAGPDAGAGARPADLDRELGALRRG
jgi:alkanesulfonate monooxygenase SsuD/methylene tetrahydromethanopterin reductase-like flavin-dependent oxidoreductase (luciferase family)